MKFSTHPDPASFGAYMNQRSGIERRCGQGSPKVWSEASNHQKYSTRFPDEDPPFFLRRASSSSGTNVAPGSPQLASSEGRSNTYKELMHTELDSTVRSIIDDLTVENRLLRARNKSFQRRERCNQDVERDKLFEISLHNISPNDAKDLEDLLSDFVRRRTVAPNNTTPQYLENTHSTLAHIPDPPAHESGLDNGKSSIHATQSGRSKVDSGYASMSMTTGPRSSSRLNNGTTEYRKKSSPSHLEKRSQLPGVPRGLLPTQTHVTTERNKKKLVVQRLEELFTGKKLLIRNQKSSPDAAVQETVNQQALDSGTIEGSREAKIMSHPLPIVPKGDSGKASDQPETESKMDDSTESDESLEQRPTRLLDLDPERQQIPAENVDYMRHLGMSTPNNLQTEDPKEAGPDAEGWVYLNLLMNMAQLHIMNVTADFVRDAVEELSSKFQLSSDGRRLRWRGGTENTRLSSLSGSTTTPQSSTDSDSQEKASDETVGYETRKFADALHAVPKTENRGRMNFHSSGLLSHRRVRKNEERHRAYYSPIFSHTSSENTDNSDDPGTISPGNLGVGSKRMMASNAEYSPPAKKRKTSTRRHRGMVFYNEAPFFVDFSGSSSPSKDGGDANDCDYANDSNDSLSILGCEDHGKERYPESMSESSQYMATRKSWDRLKLSDMMLPSPDQLEPEELESYFNFGLGDTISEDDTATKLPLMEFPIPMEACCLGCTTPADHFLETVTTQLHVSESLQSKQEDSDPSGNNQEYDLESAWKRITDRMAHLNSGLETLARTVKENRFNDSKGYVLASHRKPGAIYEPKVARKIINVTFRQLEPSPAPPPALYLSEMSESTDGESTEDESESESIREGLHPPGHSNASSVRKRVQRTSPMPRKIRDRDPKLSANDSSPEMHPQLNAPLGAAKPGPTRKDSFEEEDESSGVGEEEDDDYDESIDMLGYAREADPRGTSLVEKEWEMERAREMEMDLDDENSLQAVPSPGEQSSASVSSIEEG